MIELMILVAKSLALVFWMLMKLVIFFGGKMKCERCTYSLVFNRNERRMSKDQEEKKKKIVINGSMSQEKPKDKP